MKKFILALLLMTPLSGFAAGYMDVVGCDGFPIATVAVDDSGNFLIAPPSAFIADFELGAIAADAYLASKEQGNVMEFDFRKLVPHICKQINEGK